MNRQFQTKVNQTSQKKETQENLTTKIAASWHPQNLVMIFHKEVEIKEKISNLLLNQRRKDKNMMKTLKVLIH